MRCKLDSTENLRLFEKYPTLPSDFQTPNLPPQPEAWAPRGKHTMFLCCRVYCLIFLCDFFFVFSQNGPKYPQNTTPHPILRMNAYKRFIRDDNTKALLLSKKREECNYLKSEECNYLKSEECDYLKISRTVIPWHICCFITTSSYAARVDVLLGGLLSAQLPPRATRLEWTYSQGVYFGQLVHVILGGSPDN